MRVLVCGYVVQDDYVFVVLLRCNASKVPATSALSYCKPPLNRRPPVHSQGRLFATAGRHTPERGAAFTKDGFSRGWGRIPGAHGMGREGDMCRVALAIGGGLCRVPLGIGGFIVLFGPLELL